MIHGGSTLACILSKTEYSVNKVILKKINVCLLKKKKNPNHEQILGHWEINAFSESQQQPALTHLRSYRCLCPNIRGQIFSNASSQNWYSTSCWSVWALNISIDNCYSWICGYPMSTTTTTLHSLRKVTYPQHSICRQVPPPPSCWQAWQSASVQIHWICNQEIIISQNHELDTYFWKKEKSSQSYK